jgi:serine/threonine protein kinase
VVLLNT